MQPIFWLLAFFNLALTFGCGLATGLGFVPAIVGTICTLTCLCMTFACAFFADQP